MTTRPKAEKYRTRRTARQAAPEAPAPQAAAPQAEGEAQVEALFDTYEDGFGSEPFPTAAASGAPAPATPEEELAAIRAEGLTGRQLRMARRVAQRHGIEAESDHDAVRQLRRRGIDPFQRSSVLELVGDRAQEPEGRVQLPQTARPIPVPSPEVLTPDTRAREIIRMQRDIARRRRRKLLLLAARLAVFVLLPTLIAAWYYFSVATPLYATKTEFVIQKAEGAAGAGMGGLFSGTQFATQQDSITVQGYLQSREAMLRLDRDHGFRTHWSQDHIDPIQRLEPGATDEAAYKLYKRNVKISYDQTEGIIKMEVIAADPAVSQTFSEALIGYAEEQVDHLTQRLRAGQMSDAEESLADAEARVTAAQEKVQELQEQLGVLDPMSETSALMGQITNWEMQLQQKRLELAQLQANPSPNRARVQGVEGDITRIEGLVAQLRAQLTAGTGGTASLAVITGQLRRAEAELQTSQLMLSQAMQLRETARIEANRQVRYLETGVSPIAPDEPTYPRAFEDTVLALLIFSGIYLMLSLTASILREQVSA